MPCAMRGPVDLKRQPPVLDGVLTLYLAGRTGIYRKVDGEVQELDSVSQHAISTVPCSGHYTGHYTIEGTA